VPDRSSSLRSMRSPTVSPADARSVLGPRSLDPDRPFRERVCRAYLGPDVAYRLLQLHSSDMRATKPELSFPRRDDGLDHLPFLSRHALSLAEAVLSGEPCIRPIRSSPGAGSSRFHGFARPRYCFERDTLVGYPPKG
jgi:hypothetical protein